MIKTEAGYKRTVSNVKTQEELIRREEKRFKDIGLSPEEMTIALQPMQSYQEQLKEEIQEYEDTRAGKFAPITDLRDIGRNLIRLRIHKGVTQAELATKMGVDVSQISRDESNEYYGSRLEKMMAVLDALDVDVEIKLNIRRNRKTKGRNRT